MAAPLWARCNCIRGLGAYIANRTVPNLLSATWSVRRTCTGRMEMIMGASCCSHDAKFDGVSADYKRRLWLVIAINAAMFAVEIAAGALAGSQALQADALDFAADAATYGVSLAVIGASLRTRALAAFAKGLSLTLMGLWVFGATAYHVLVLGLPRAEVM